MMEEWKLIKSERLLSTKPFNVLKRTYDKPNGEGSLDTYVMECPDWVNIIAMNDDDEIILIRQFRFGSKSLEWEIPGGVIEAGEPPIEAAKRELLEETGYISENWTQLGVVDANPAIMTNKCYTFLAQKIKDTGSIHPDPDEIIEHRTFSPDEVRDMIKNGKITNAYIIAAFFWFSNYRKDFLM